MNRRRKRYYYYYCGKVASALLYDFQVDNLRHFKTFTEAKKYSMRYLANHMNSLMANLQTYVNYQKQLQAQKRT